MVDDKIDNCSKIRDHYILIIPNNLWDLIFRGNNDINIKRCSLFFPLFFRLLLDICLKAKDVRFPTPVKIFEWEEKGEGERDTYTTYTSRLNTTVRRLNVRCTAAELTSPPFLRGRSLCLVKFIFCREWRFSSLHLLSRLAPSLSALRLLKAQRNLARRCRYCLTLLSVLSKISPVLVPSFSLSLLLNIDSPFSLSSYASLRKAPEKFSKLLVREHFDRTSRACVDRTRIALLCKKILEIPPALLFD